MVFVGKVDYFDWAKNILHFYTNRFVLTNNTAKTQNYTLLRPWALTEPPILTINDKPQPCELNDDKVVIKVVLNSGEKVGKHERRDR